MEYIYRVEVDWASEDEMIWKRTKNGRFAMKSYYKLVEIRVQFPEKKLCAFSV